MLVVGLTGGIATGKSTVSSLLASHGIPVIDADILAREVVLPGTRAHSRIVFEFGKDILLPDGSLDRPKLGDIIFKDEAKRKTLNGIVHPAVRRAMGWNVFKCWISGKKICILDVPLLVEAGIWKWMGKVVVVYCSAEIQLARLMHRDGSTVNKASSRLDSQLPISQKRDYADHVVDNSGSLDDLEGQVSSLVETLEKEVTWYWWWEWLVPPLGLLAAVGTLVWRANRRHSQPKRA